MKNLDGLIKVVDLSIVEANTFKKSFVGCIVLSKDRKILLQQRPDNWWTHPGCLSTFGGKIETGEQPIEALVRELKEELGAIVLPSGVIRLGVITEAITKYTELIHVYFWHDEHGTITGCYECEAKYFDSFDAAYAHPKIMDDVCWMLRECQNRNLLQETELKF